MAKPVTILTPVVLTVDCRTSEITSGTYFQQVQVIWGDCLNGPGEQWTTAWNDLKSAARDLGHEAPDWIPQYDPDQFKCSVNVGTPKQGCVLIVNVSTGEI